MPVLQAFAAECLLKGLSLRENGRYLKTHDLHDLYEALGPESKPHVASVEVSEDAALAAARRSGAGLAVIDTAPHSESATLAVTLTATRRFQVAENNTLIMKFNSSLPLEIPLLDSIKCRSSQVRPCWTS